MTHQVQLFTYKTGLLSRVAHDLRLSVGGPCVGRSGERVHAKLDPAAIVVDGVMSAGRLDPEALGRRDRAKIVATIRDEILHVRRFPSVDFEGTLREQGEGLRVEGSLTLHGVARSLTIHATRDPGSGRVRASVELRPSEFGIPPYKALAGAIRLQDRVRVELDLDPAL
ncbi:YceI family protein [Pseudenhygromyxa sp. WMMC2535]|uniref:YceI family protein n=1 Tax=Pseudenhygromyxa sp. WMMC2535 TaxID=2712867 RepID=UPI0015538EEB|nr:YceI family protein [Pseudenhygromyxa sp. WMMC2535]NVB39774.1 YceI family protein [Pseudenhygromyxa sp. WMMC2535]